MLHPDVVTLSLTASYGVLRRKEKISIQLACNESGLSDVYASVGKEMLQLKLQIQSSCCEGIN